MTGCPLGCATHTQVPQAGSWAWLCLESPFPPFSDWEKKNPLISLAYLEWGFLYEVFPNCPSMLTALISPCSAPLPTAAQDPSTPFSCTWVCLPAETISAYGQGWHSIYLCTLQWILAERGNRFVGCPCDRKHSLLGHLAVEDNACPRNCPFLWPVRTHTTHSGLSGNWP